MNPFIRDNELFFEKVGHSPMLFLEYYQQILDFNANTHFEIRQKTMESTGDLVFGVRLFGPYNTAQALKDCKQYMIANL